MPPDWAVCPNTIRSPSATPRLNLAGLPGFTFYFVTAAASLASLPGSFGRADVPCL
ncbi:MAG: hypothetical protein WCF33_06650 [Pseudonocardiaceae bacterium]